MINKTDLLLFALARKALNKDYCVDKSLFVDVNWPEVIDVATTQGIVGLCFDAIELIPQDCRPDLDNLMEWLGVVSFVEASYDEHKKTIKELAHFYLCNDIKMLLLKGYGISNFWPVPNHRPVGDIDIYLGHLWQFGDSLLHEKLGIKVENGHEHHTCFNFKGIMVENHYDFINVKAHKDAPKIEAKLKELAEWNLCTEFPSIDNVYVPSADFNAIFLIRHLGQHFAGERVTLRQLLDWGLFLQHEGNKVHWDEVVPFLKEMGIWTFFNQINAICEDYLGIKLGENVPKIERNEKLEKRIVEDILHPEFNEEKPSKLLPVLWFKLKRWWYNRWKHPLIYDEWLLPMFFTLLWSHIRRIETIKD